MVCWDVVCGVWCVDVVCGVLGCGVWCVVCWDVVCGVWCVDVVCGVLGCGVWCVVCGCGVWCVDVVCGVWCVVCGCGVFRTLTAQVRDMESGPDSRTVRLTGTARTEGRADTYTESQPVNHTSQYRAILASLNHSQ